MMTEIEHKQIEPAPEYTVVTVVPYTDGPEYREYRPDPDELPMLLESIDDERVAEMVVSVEPRRRPED